MKSSNPNQFKGRKNQYDCQKCGQSIITVDRDAGVTPFMIECRATRGCDGEMHSHFYRVSQGAEPSFEWIIPTDAQIEAYVQEYLDNWPNENKPTTLLATMKEWVATGHLMLFPVQFPVSRRLRHG